MIGPTIQQELFSILLRFRTHLFLYTSDILKMYRQILVHKSQTRYQRIIWRYNESDDIEIYELNTITYGTAPASYLSTQCLQYLADLEVDNFPLGAIVVRNDFYVDDLLTGADTLFDAKLLRDEVILLLEKG